MVRVDERFLQMFSTALREVPDRVVLADADGIVTWVNPAVERRTGHRAAELVGTTATDLLDAGTVAMRARMRHTLGAGVVFHGDFLVRTRGGIAFHEDGTVTPIVEAGAVVGFVYTATDDAELRDLEQELERIESVDRLTRLPNRRAFFDHGDWITGRSPPARFAVVLLEIDRLATLADAHGFSACDEILRRVARRIVREVSPEAMVARVTDHGFALLLEGADAAEAKAQSEVLLRALAAPIQTADARRYVHGHVGVACFPEHGTTCEDLLAHASTAAHQSLCNADTVVVYEPAMLSGALVEADLHEAFAGEQFFLRYQPIVSLRGEEPAFVEALARWRRPERGVVSPGEFLPLVHEVGLSTRFDRYALRHACRQARAWSDRGLSVRVAVNLSAQSFNQPNIVEWIAAEVDAHGVSPGAILLEITETAAMVNPATAATRVAELRRLGLHVAIDDFGTGHSSLAYIKNFEISELKIDRSFVTGIGASPKTEMLVRTMLSLAKSLGLATVAEGVETEAQRDWLADAGCDYMQGWLMSRALDADQAESFLRAAS